MLKVKVTSSMKMIMVMKMEMSKILTSSLSRSPEDKCVYRNLPWIFSHWVPFPDPGPPSRNNIGKKVIINLLFSLWYYEIGWNRLKFRVLRAKRGTGLKKLHHQRWWRWWLIWGIYHYHAPEKERSSLWWISRLLKWNLKKTSQLWDKCWPNVDRVGVFILSSWKPQTWICERLLN